MSLSSIEQTLARRFFFNKSCVSSIKIFMEHLKVSMEFSLQLTLYKNFPISERPSLEEDLLKHTR